MQSEIDALPDWSLLLESGRWLVALAQRGRGAADRERDRPPARDRVPRRRRGHRPRARPRPLRRAGTHTCSSGTARSRRSRAPTGWPTPNRFARTSCPTGSTRTRCSPTDGRSWSGSAPRSSSVARSCGPSTSARRARSRCSGRASRACWRAARAGGGCSARSACRPATRPTSRACIAAALLAHHRHADTRALVHARSPLRAHLPRARDVLELDDAAKPRRRDPRARAGRHGSAGPAAALPRARRRVRRLPRGPRLRRLAGRADDPRPGARGRAPAGADSA